MSPQFPLRLALLLALATALHAQARARAAGASARCRRDARGLIGTFDISKIFQKRIPRPAQPAAALHPSAAPLAAPPPPPGAGASAPPAPARHAAAVPGDVVLGGLVSVHARGLGGAGGARCGRVSARGVQALEALLFALDAAQAAAPRGVRLGVHVLDDCSSDAYGLEMALDFIKGSVGDIDSSQRACNASARSVVSGVVGAASSLTSVQVANLLRLFRIPQVSYFSTSPELSNKARFEYFTRTIPSDLHQVRAMLEIVKRFGWTYISVVYEDSNYGMKAFEELETQLARSGVCIAVKERLPAGGEAAVYDAAVSRLLARPRARAVIVFAAEAAAAALLAAAARRNVTRALAWLGSDGWHVRAEGALCVRPTVAPLGGFAQYFLNLTVDNNVRNPWFVEFWEQHFGCEHSPGARSGRRAARPPCSGRERLAAGAVQFDPQLQFVADAVLALAHAVRALHEEACGGAPGACAAMRPGGAALLRHLRRVRFTGMSGEEFRFDGNGDGPARYDILHYRRDASGAPRWRRVGDYRAGRLRLRDHELQFTGQSARPPESVCSAECELGQAKQYVEGESCCWHCFNCTRYEVALETACVACALGTLPDAARRRCEPLPVLHVRADEPTARAALALAALGLVLTAMVAGVWLARGDTPVVRASGRELSLVLLGGLALCYALTPALLQRPSAALCALQRFGAGFGPTVVYAALLTKTSRIARIFAAGRRSARRVALVSPRSQLAICGALVALQAAGAAVWQAAAPARAERHFPSRERQLLVCAWHADASPALAAAYPALLGLVCTVYAVLTRDIPEAFNESKHIGFAMYTTCVIWLAFVPLYFGTAAHVPLRVTSMAVTISLSASVTLVCLFAPKVYIIVVRPERNVRAPLMPARWRGAGAGGGAARGAVCAALVGAAHSAAPAPAPPPDPTPSTDRSSLQDAPAARAERHAQTDDAPLYPRLRRALAASDGVLLDARRLARGAGGAGARS